MQWAQRDWRVNGGALWPFVGLLASPVATKQFSLTGGPSAEACNVWTIVLHGDEPPNFNHCTGVTHRSTQVIMSLCQGSLSLGPAMGLFVGLVCS